jgi:nucleotide-binding universal stress UspA family protein
MTSTLQQLHRIVVPIDDVPDHERAIRIAVELGVALGVAVEVISIVPAARRADADAAMAAKAAEFGPGVLFSAVTGAPDVASTLMKIGNRADTLLCLASRGSTSAGELLLGSVSATVFRMTHHPVVVVGPHCTERLHGREIAVALDGTPEAEAILPTALAMADALALSTTLYQAGEVGSAVPMDTNETSYLHGIAERARPGRVLNYEALHDESPEMALSRLATSDDVAMVAVTTRSITALQRLLHGSVASDVVRHASCPVLVQSIW